MSRMSPGVLAPPHELLTPEQWKQRGREQRRQVPLLSHAQWEPPPDRPNPVDILEEQARTRVPDLVPIRHGRMIASPFAYFRGAAAPMAWDLAHTPTTGIRVQACGDAHLLNFGMFAAPDRRLVFDVNDFDETLPAPFEWDLKRLAASFAVAAREQEFGDHDAHTAARLTVRSYRTEMFRYATMRFLKVWYSRIDIDEVTGLFDELQPKKAVKRRRNDIAKARQRTSLKAFLKMCDKVDGQYRIRQAHPVIVRYPIERHPGIVVELRHAEEHVPRAPDGASKWACEAARAQRGSSAAAPGGRAGAFGDVLQCRPSRHPAQPGHLGITHPRFQLGRVFLAEIGARGGVEDRVCPDLPAVRPVEDQPVRVPLLDLPGRIA